MRTETRQQHVGGECFFVEECRALQPHALIEVLIEIFVEAIDLDAEFLQQTKRFFAVVMRSLKRLSSAVSNQQPLAGLKLIAFGVSAEIVVIVEDENLRLRSRKFAEEVCGSKTAYAPAHYDQI